jgi:hypothetical protein
MWSSDALSFAYDFRKSEVSVGLLFVAAALSECEEPGGTAPADVSSYVETSAISGFGPVT